MKVVSVSKSSSIRDIENKYNINLTSCTKSQLDALTSKVSKSKAINKLSDLMVNTHQFDVDNMSEIERANLKYLVMSTDEVLETLNRKSKSIYYKPQEARLRWLMSYNDFYQICAYKLLLNDGILRFNANYKLEPAIHCWLMRTAMWQTHKKASVADEVCILDKPCGDDNETTIGDLMLKDHTSDMTTNIDLNEKISWILSSMDKTESNRIVLKANNTSIPYSEHNLAKLFVVYQLGKKELSKLVYNKETKKLVSNQIFNKLYKSMMLHIASLLNSESSSSEEFINICESDL